MTILMPIAAHLCFIAGYIFYVRQFLLNCGMLIYPIYIAPAVIYLLLIITTTEISHLRKEKFIAVYKKISLLLFIFGGFFLTTIVLRFNFPDPHNFVQRKLEILLGASYALFIILLAIITIKSLINVIDIENIPIRKLCLYIAVFFFVVYFSISLWFNYANEPTGDEPAYLLTTYSLIHDGDLDLKNNFDNKDYKEFYHRELEPQTGDIKRDGKIFSLHSPLYPFLMIPFYFAGHRFGVSVATNLTAMALIIMIFLTAFKIFGNKKTAIFTALTAGMTLPIIEYINITATEMLSPALILLAYILLNIKKQKFLFSTVVAISILLHPRNILLAISLCLLYMYYNRKDLKAIILLVLTMFSAAVLLLLFNHAIYGIFFPSYSPGNEGSVMQNFKPHLIKGIFVQLLDRQMGLFPYAPIYILVFAGIFLLFRDNKKVVYEMAIIFVPYFVMIISWRDWGSGNSAPRYLMPLMFIFAVSIGAIYKNINGKAMRFIFKLLSAINLLITTIICCLPWFRWSNHSDDNWIVDIIDKVLHINLKFTMPSYMIDGQHPFYLTLLWVVFIAAINIYFAIQALKTKKPDNI